MMAWCSTVVGSARLGSDFVRQRLLEDGQYSDQSTPWSTAPHLTGVEERLHGIQAGMIMVQYEILQK